jgi:aminomethyltransferase
MNKTSLYDQHVRLGAQMVPFAGFLMPLQYTSITAEHQAVRRSVGLFDVSHMGEIFIKGPESHALVNQLVTNIVPLGRSEKAVYGLLCNEMGFVLDDLFVYPLAEDEYLLVVNASNLAKDEAWIRIQSHAYDVIIDNASDRYGQLALQGPDAEALMIDKFGSQYAQLRFMQYATADFEGAQVLISRSGYTGEDGYELYADPNTVAKLWDYFIQERHVTPCGLGCRDTLRFEGALSLYGHEIDENATPLEAGLKFAVKFEKEFIGKQALKTEFEAGPTRRLVGLEVIGRGIARADYEVYADHQKIGRVTTGYLLSGHQRPLALALIDTKYAQIGTNVDIMIRNIPVPAVVRDTIFMDKKYKR